MGTKKIKQTEIECLAQNKYVNKVSSKSITYSDSFKEEYMILRKQDKMPREIFKEMGFDPEVLGQQRIDSIDKRLRKKAEAKESLHDQRKNHSGRTEKVDFESMNLKQQVDYLKSEVEYYKQANEFIKKNIEIEERYILKQKKKQSQKSTK